MTSIEIQYCVPCGHLPRAQGLQEAILETFGLDVDSVTLKTGDGGVFTVHVDGEKIFDKAEDPYERDAIIDQIDARVGQPA